MTIEEYMRKKGWLPPGYGRHGHLKTEPGPFARYGWQDTGRLRWQYEAGTLDTHGSLRWCALVGQWRLCRGVYNACPA